MWKSKNQKIENQKTYGLLHANDVLEVFVNSTVINVEPKFTKLDEPILKSLEPNPPHSLMGHCILPKSPTFPKILFWPPFYSFDVQFELNPNYADVLPLFTSFEDPYSFIGEFEGAFFWFTFLGYMLMLWG